MVYLYFSLNFQLHIERCAIEHPHHTISNILAISHAFLDSSNTMEACNDTRIMGAKVLFTKLRKNEKISLIAGQMNDMSKGEPPNPICYK